MCHTCVIGVLLVCYKLLQVVIWTFGLHVYATLLLYVHVRISLLGTFISGASLFHNVICGCTTRYAIELEKLIHIYLLTTDKCSRGAIGGRVWPVIERSLVRIPVEATISGWTHMFLVIISCHSSKQTLVAPICPTWDQCAVKTNIHLINNVQSIY